MTRALTAIAICSISVLFGAATASAAEHGCGKAVLADWMDGRIEGVYATRCYADALDSLPEDVRAYTAAADDISRALNARVRAARPEASRRKPAGAGGSSASRATPVPLALASGVALAALLAIAGLAGALVRRARRPRQPQRRPRPVGQW